MFLNIWQLKVTAFVLLLSSSLGQKLFQTCDRNYCYEQSIEKRNVEVDYLRKWHRGESPVIDIERRNTFRKEYVAHHDTTLRGIRENRVKQLDSEFVRLISRKELNEEELIRLESYNLRNENRIAMAEDSRNGVSSRTNLLTVDKRDDIDSRFDSTRRTELRMELDNERRQSPVANYRSFISRHLIERENRKNANPEFRFNDRLSDIRHAFKQSREIKINTLNRESRRLVRLVSDENPEELQCTDKRREGLTRNKAETQRDYFSTELFNRDESQRLSRREQDTMDNHERLSNERERLIENRRCPERLFEEGNRQECDIRSRESRRFNARLFETERLPNKSENLRRISESESQRSKVTLKKETHLQTTRRNEDLDDRDFRRRDINRESLNLIERLNKNFQRIPQLHNNNEQEREKRDRRETLSQLAYRDNRYDISRRLNGRKQVFTLRQSENLREYLDNRERFSESDSETKQQEVKYRQYDVNSAENDSFERRYGNLRERESISNRNYESRRLNNRQVQSEKETLQNRSDIDKNQERQAILIDEDIWSWRFKMVRDTAERRYQNVNKVDERREKLTQFEKRASKRDANRPSNENIASRRMNEWHFENTENFQRRRENRDARRHNNELDIHESRRNIKLNVRQNDDLLQGSNADKRGEQNERFNQRLNSMRQDKNLDYKDFHYMMDEYIEKPTVFLKRGCMNLGQGALLAYIIMKTVNGKNDIKYNIYQKLHKAIALMGF